MLGRPVLAPAGLLVRQLPENRLGWIDRVRQHMRADRLSHDVLYGAMLRTGTPAEEFVLQLRQPGLNNGHG